MKFSFEHNLVLHCMHQNVVQGIRITYSLDIGINLNWWNLIWHWWFFYQLANLSNSFWTLSSPSSPCIKLPCALAIPLCNSVPLQSGVKWRARGPSWGSCRGCGLLLFLILLLILLPSSLLSDMSIWPPVKQAGPQVYLLFLCSLNIIFL